MTPSEIAAYFDTMRTGHHGAWATQAAATIRELEARATIAESMVAEANCSLFGSHSFFGDDKMHLSQAIEALKLESGNRWRAIKIATEALEELWGCYQALANSGDAGFWRAEDTEEGKRAMEALARIKETK